MSTTATAYATSTADDDRRQALQAFDDTKAGVKGLLLSNDRFKSVEHRVVANGAGPRVSVACFFRTYGAAASMRVLQPIVTGGDRARYKSATVEELLRHYRAKGLDGTSALDHFRL
ncbi:unnamed protein product [Triticum turgidum subsp. durum]|uniref:Isopenicillin N synthase-like Fe(2+) 2OG dioxygenase domain-containing protein n=1 Tax=Triticum turgidum subsp. durum TaxID=4567 RepID=A0A9R0Z270_TRITD|nr:unnamed protein product [Triticum turgidum subsp. durum]